MENPYQPPASGEPPPLPVPGIAGLKDPRLLGLGSLCLYGISTLGQVTDHAMRTFAVGAAVKDIRLHDTYYVVVEGPRPMEWLMTGAMLPASILFLFWKYRVAANAWIIDASRMKYSPAMSAGCYLIPFVNLVLPYKAMAAIAKASCGTTEGVAPWWAGQIILMIAGLWVGFTAPEGYGTAAPSFAEHVYLLWSILAFVLAWRIVMRITKAQSAKCTAAAP